MNINLVQSVLFRWFRLAFFPFAQTNGFIRADTSRFLLRRNAVMTVPKEFSAQHITVRRGTIWLTETPADQDIVLQAKEEFRLKNQHPFVIEALEDAEIILTP